MFKTGQLYDLATLQSRLPRQIAHTCDISNAAAEELLSPYQISLDKIDCDRVAVIGIEVGIPDEVEILLSLWTIDYSVRRQSYCLRFWKAR